MKSDSLVKFLLAPSIYKSEQLTDFICSDPNLCTCADLYTVIVTELLRHYRKGTGTKGPFDVGPDECLLMDMEHLYLDLVASNKLVSADIKFRVCTSLIDFGFLPKTLFPRGTVSKWHIDELNRLAKEYFSNVDIYSKGTSKHAIDAKNEFKSFVRTIQFGTLAYWEDLVNNGIFDAVGCFKKACLKLGAVRWREYAKFSTLSDCDNWHGELALRLIDAIHTNPFDILEEK